MKIVLWLTRRRENRLSSCALEDGERFIQFFETKSLATAMGKNPVGTKDRHPGG